MTRTRSEVERVLSLSAGGLNSFEISRQTGIPSATIRGWVRGLTPSFDTRRKAMCPRCRPFRELAPGITDFSYAYLLGLYLGDGMISHGPRGVYKLRIFLDRSYPVIVAEAEAAMGLVLPPARWASTRDVASG